MKKLFLFLFLATFVLFSSCEKDAEPEPYSLANDLQNGYWEEDIDLIVEFDGTKMIWHHICNQIRFCAPKLPCVESSPSNTYTIDNNTIIINDVGSFSIKIEGDILSINLVKIFNRRSTLWQNCN